MKKFIAIVLGAGAMIACTKTSVSYEPTGEIAISPISSVNKTKTTVTDTKFPSKQVMGVFAYYKDDVADGSASGMFKDAVTYLNNVQFNENATGVWAGWDGNAHYPYYWPKNGSLVFAAYSPLKDAAENDAIASHKFVADGTAVTSDIFAGTYVQSNETAKTVDFMWSPVTAESHTKSTNNVKMTFYHAMSWITFQAYFVKPDGMAAPAEGHPVITIKSISLSKVATKGTYATAANKIAWTPSTVADDIKNITVFSGTQPLTESAANVETTANGTLVIPQAIGNDLVATVTYDQEVPGTAKVEQTAILHLNQCKVDNADLKVWENAKHYTYVLKFTFGEDEEILINPVVSKWEDVTVDTTGAVETVTK